MPIRLMWNENVSRIMALGGGDRYLAEMDHESEGVIA